LLLNISRGKSTMNQPLPSPDLSEKEPAASLGRRELLKALAASGGAVAATILPGQWAEPVVEVGLLPAHAQASAPGQAPPLVQPVIFSCGGLSFFLQSPNQVLFDNDERIINLFAQVTPAPPVGTLIRYDVSVNGAPIVIDEPILPAPTDATGLADFGSSTVRPIGGFDSLTPGDIVTITFSFEPPIDPTFDPTPCTADFTVIA
jgi:hypothetical protein